jgi:hypothetical protein
MKLKVETWLPWEHAHLNKIYVRYKAKWQPAILRILSLIAATR